MEVTLCTTHAYHKAILVLLDTCLTQGITVQFKPTCNVGLTTTLRFYCPRLIVSVICTQEVWDNNMETLHSIADSLYKN